MELAKLNEPVRQEAMRLSRFDLNLLVVFEALMEERSVSRAADRLALSQPATSHALGRLRALLGDKLFVRTPSGMEPTDRALQLATPIRCALEGFQQALEPEDFSPATVERGFRLAVNNHAALVLATPILTACTAEAPGIRLDIRPSGTLPIDDLLDRGELDFVITAQPLDRQRFASKMLIEDEYRIVMRAAHPQAAHPMTLDAFAALRRIEVSSSGEDMGFITRALSDAGLRVETAGSIPYLALSALLRASDYGAVVRSQIARTLSKSGEIVSCPLPFSSRRVASVLSWHQRHSSHLAYVWMIELIERTSRALSNVEGVVPNDL
jgi:DNA-binding transcriptional LysR family regulator